MRRVRQHDSTPAWAPLTKLLSPFLLAGCGAAKAPAPTAASSPAAASSPTLTSQLSEAPPNPHANSNATASVCPPDMAHVRHEYCPTLEHRCKKSEYDKSNHITICHEFEAEQKTCRGERRLVDVCVDRFEYPNQKGGHPPVMVDFFDAEKSCQALGKRLCLESEWVAACEGPSEQPFPYGWERSSEACNIDNTWVEPNLARVYAKDPEIQRQELERLDRSVPSGSKEAC